MVARKENTHNLHVQFVYVEMPYADKLKGEETDRKQMERKKHKKHKKHNFEISK